MNQALRVMMMDDGKELILMSREQSSMVSTWSEMLCLNKVSSSKWSIGIYSYEILGSIYELIPEEKRLYDEDGRIIAPDEVDGKAVFGLEDGEYVQTDELVLREEGVEFDASSLQIARDTSERTVGKNVRKSNVHGNG
jgi:hypothetical protein